MMVLCFIEYNVNDALDDVLSFQKLMRHLDIDVSSDIFSDVAFTFLMHLKVGDTILRF